MCSEICKHSVPIRGRWDERSLDHSPCSERITAADTAPNETNQLVSKRASLTCQPAASYQNRNATPIRLETSAEGKHRNHAFRNRLRIKVRGDYQLGASHSTSTRLPLPPLCHNNRQYHPSDAQYLPICTSTSSVKMLELSKG
jgi:hypothetical protein